MVQSSSETLLGWMPGASQLAAVFDLRQPAAAARVARVVAVNESSEMGIGPPVRTDVEEGRDLGALTLVR